MSGRNLFLGIDVGTTSVKAAFVDEDGQMLAQAFREYPLYQPFPNWAEQNPTDWWNATAQVVSDLSGKEEIKGQRVAGISVSCQAPTCLGIDREGKPVGNALIWMDRRSQEVCNRDLAPHTKLVRVVCGNRVDPYYFLPKFLWHRENRPQESERVDKYLQINGWIVFCMTGQTSIDTTHLTHLQVYDVFHDCWSEEMLRLFDMDRRMFPKVCAPDEVVGQLTESAAKQMGLSAGIPVVAGCTDAAATAIGMQHTKPGCLFEMSGQSSGIGLVTDCPVDNPYLNLSRGALPNLWNQKGSMSTTGGSLRWFRDVIDGKKNDPKAYQNYDMLAEQSPTGANGIVFLPYLMGERAPLWDSNACGMFFGLRSMTEKADMLRAILEGAAYGLRTIRDKFDPKLLQGAVLTGVGGGYKSKLWAQIKADVLDMPIQVQHVDYDGACMGDAILAAKHTGRQIHKAFGKDSALFTPDKERAKVYSEQYEIFQQLYLNNKELMKLNFENLKRQNRTEGRIK